MSYFKKFTDFCAGLGAFVAALLFLRTYMGFSPVIEEDAPPKLEQFFKSSPEGFYNMLISLCILLALSVLVGRVFSKLPYVCFGVSLLPALQMAFMFEKKAFFQLQAFMIIIVGLHVMGNIADCTIRDRVDGKHRLWISAKISSLGGILLSFVILWLIKRPIPELTDDLCIFKKELFTKFTDGDIEVITKLFWMFTILFLLSIIVYNVYFIDAILSVVPAVYATHAMISGNLGIISTVFFTASIICAATHICLALMENNLSRKEQLKMKT